jgi:hypothetical protein
VNGTAAVPKVHILFQNHVLLITFLCEHLSLSRAATADLEAAAIRRAAAAEQKAAAKQELQGRRRKKKLAGAAR